MNKSSFIKMTVSTLSILLAISLYLQSGLTLSTVHAQDVAVDSDYESYTSQIESYSSLIRYAEYAQQHIGTGYFDDEYIIEASDYINTEEMQAKSMEDYDGNAGSSILTGEQGIIEWEVDIKQSGNYNIVVEYFPYEGKSSSIQRSILIDGNLPFAEASTVEFYRYWGNEKDVIQVDNMGNDIRPRQVEKPQWNEVTVGDSRGYYAKPFEFYLEKGVHKISMVSQREPMLIRRIKLVAPDVIPTYKEVSSEYSKNGYRNATVESVRIDAESATAKSTPMLYGVSDHSSPAIEPYSPSSIKINTIGGNTWKSAGQWLEWEVDVPQTGLYKLAVNVKQNFVRGVPVKRKLTIDGEVPFIEAEQVDFNYKNGWNVEAMGGDKPYLFYFEEGKHTIRMEAILGDLSDHVRTVEDSLRNLNEIYRSIMMLTGAEPDKYRDYQIQKKMPNLAEDLRTERDRLQSVVDGLKSVAGKGSDKEAVINTMITQLDELSNDVEKVIPKLLDFQKNIGGMGTWLITINEMPLQLDALYLIGADEKLPKTRNSFFDNLWHEIKAMFMSFFVDYNSIGNVATEGKSRNITVWVGTGRDQANSLKTMIDESFTNETGIGVNLMLVDMNTLLQATLAGQGPDVAMQVANNLPMNYAMRGAVADLKQFEGFNEVTKRFNNSALVPFRFRDSCYALPETQTFPMLFYRKDILKEQGLDVPNTWDDVKASISTLSKNNMTFGMMPSPEQGYGMFLYQMGGEFYTSDATASALDSDIGVNAFKEWTKYYTDYTLEREFDFANRFRTGEMPMGIADYAVYNTLQVSAPEIQGLWEFTEVPGTVREDGTIDKTVPAGGQAVVVMEQSADKEASWEYLKWWTSAETQVKFGREMEGLMGPAARYPTANMEALSMLPWPTRDYENLQSQFLNVKGIPEVPGGYFTGRNINNAFYKVVVEKSLGAREALTDNIRFINDEISYKRNEFNLD